MIWQLGYCVFSGDLRYNGIIDEVRIYNRALSEDEIKEIMNAKGLAVVTPSGMLATRWGALKNNK